MRQYLRYYFSNNVMEYVKLFFVFIIGVVVSIFVINNSNVALQGEIRSFIDSKIEVVKCGEYDNKNEVFGVSLRRNLRGFVFVVFLASTVIGIPFAYWFVARRAFSIGYTISAVFATQNARTAIIFICNSLILHNIIYMASVFVVLVAGVNFVRSFFANGRTNVRFEVFKYFIFVLFGLLLVIMSSLFEAYVSTNFLYLFKKYL